MTGDGPCTGAGAQAPAPVCPGRKDAASGPGTAPASWSPAAGRHDDRRWSLHRSRAACPAVMPPDTDQGLRPSPPIERDCQEGGDIRTPAANSC